MRGWASRSRRSYTPAELAQAFGVEIKGKADIFDSLVKAGKARDFKEALELAAKKLPSNRQAWSALAQWSLDFDKAKELFGKGSGPAPQANPTRVAARASPLDPLPPL